MQKLFGKHSLLRYIVILLLIYIPLYQKFPFLTIPGSQVALRLEDLLIFTGILTLILVNFRSILSIVFKDKLFRSFGFFWFIGLLSLLSAVFVTKTVMPLVGLLHWVRRIEYMSVFFLGLYATQSKKDVASYIKTISLVVALVFVYAIGQKYYNWPVITTQNSEYAKGIALRYVDGSHLFSTFAGHYDLAGYLILILPIFYALIFAKRKLIEELGIFKSVTLTRVYFSTICVFGLWLLVNAASRISIVAYLISISVLFFLIRKLRYLLPLIAVTFIFITMSSNLIDRYTRIFRVTLEVFAQEEEAATLRLNSRTPEPQNEAIYEDRSSSIRFNVEWPRAVRSLLKNPLLGTGYSSITLATDNDYLRMLGEIGLIGTLSFGLVVFWILWKLLLSLKLTATFDIAEAFVLGLFSSLFGIGVNLIFIDLLEASKFAILFWLMLGIAVNIVSRYKYE